MPELDRSLEIRAERQLNTESDNKSAYFDKIKKIIADNPKYYAQSYCVQSAHDMVKLLTGEEPRMPDHNPEHYCTTRRFFNKGSDGKHSNPFVERLLDQSPSSEHLVFHISLPRDIHDFIVYKECNETEITYRILQSNLGRFSLGAWLGVSEAPEGFQESDEYQEFGGGQKVTIDQVIKFIKNNLEMYQYDGWQTTHVNIHTISAELLNTHRIDQALDKTSEESQAAQDLLTQNRPSAPKSDDNLSRLMPELSLTLESAAKNNSPPSPSTTGFFSAPLPPVTPAAYLPEPSLHIGTDIAPKAISQQSEELIAHLRIDRGVNATGKMGYTFYLHNIESLSEQQLDSLDSAMRAVFVHQRGYTESNGYIIRLTLEDAEIAQALELRLTTILTPPPDVIDLSKELSGDASPTSPTAKLKHKTDVRAYFQAILR